MQRVTSPRALESSGWSRRLLQREDGVMGNQDMETKDGDNSMDKFSCDGKKGSIKVANEETE